MALLLLKYFAFYCLYIGIGCGFFALHFITVTKDKLHWLFWPDIDVKVINNDFVYEYITAMFCVYVVFLWPIRLLHILLIFTARIIGLTAISFVTGFLLVCDFFVKEKVVIIKFLRRDKKVC